MRPCVLYSVTDTIANSELRDNVRTKQMRAAMATINENEHVIAHCPTCDGALTAFLTGDPQRWQIV
jgi:hypothetical protein